MIAVVALAAVMAQPPQQADPGSARAEALQSTLLTRPKDTQLYIELTREYLRRGKTADAEATLRAGLRNAGDPTLVRQALVDYLAQQERWSDAADMAVSLAVDSAGKTSLAALRTNAGIAAYRKGDRRRAREQWEQALRDDPALPEASVSLAAAMLDAGARDSARTVIARGLRYHPSNSTLLLLRAQAVGGPEGLASALTALRQLRAKDPTDEATGLQLARILLAAGNQIGVIALYDSLVKAPNATENTFIAATDFWLDGGQAKAAIETAEKGVAKFSRSGRLYALLGEAEAERSQWQDAVSAYRRAASLLPQPEPAEVALLEVYVSAHDTARGLEMVNELAQRPASRAALLRVPRSAVRLGSAAAADSIYGFLLQRDSADIEALEARAALAETRHDTAAAVVLYRRAVSRDSSGPAPALALLRLTRPAVDSARWLLRQGAWRGMTALQALELSNAAVASAATTPRQMTAAQPQLERQNDVRALLRGALDTIVYRTSWGPAELEELRKAFPHSAVLELYAANLNAAAGKDSAALATYDRVLRQGGTDVELQLRRATLLERMGRSRDAAAGYARAFDLDPANDSTFRTLQRARQQDGSLEQLLGQVRRLRKRLPDSRALAEHEVEVLQRLGRLAEAQAVAKDAPGKKK